MKELFSIEAAFYKGLVSTPLTISTATNPKKTPCMIGSGKAISWLAYHVSSCPLH
jgi:hypothetical protein